MAEEKDIKETLDVMEKAKRKLLVEKQHSYFFEGNTLPMEFRRKQLLKLKQALQVYEPRIMEALKKDLGKSAFESYETELGMVLSELNFALLNLKKWTKKKNTKTPWVHFPSKSAMYQEPLGVVLILSPWNYPLQLSLAPLVSCIAAGNCAVLKPSHSAPHTTAIMEEMISTYFAPEYIAVISGETEISQELLKLKFDYIFFTGSPAVGKIVMKAASKHLTPVTLELGGKSPCIVDGTANIEIAARRIVWGKFLNAGQTCVAPDYVLVDESVKERLVDRMIQYILAFYGTKPLKSKDLPHIINEKHFNRLCGLLEGQNIRYGGKFDAEIRKIEPTILTEVKENSAVMQEEIFGPLLPILTYNKLENAIDFIKKREKPLALYLFTNSQKNERKILQKVSFGGGCINDTIVHLANPHLSFGGVGQSGMGAYHGKKGFETFSHEKSILKKHVGIDIPLRYPPYMGKLGLLHLLLK
ncbi:aldehyde dehydrogenase [Anaerovorax sp. IOR16]|uniref:aldehyde dehydrogenase n=1 Tax=Anaerovorax sp. IOR16 TaxID=2773458 RepID=UPI001FD685D1|nr:aldehyde dehydrogenase [Anaerovorax sp. IOR16]